jgi:hypothetical protein
LIALLLCFERNSVKFINLLFPLLFWDLGKDAKIVLVIDNATWHNRLTNDTTPPKRSWRKEAIMRRLSSHNIVFPEKVVRTQLLEIALNNLPEKRYEMDEAAKKYNVGILR